MIRNDQLEAFKDSKLEEVGSDAVLTFKLTPKGRFHWCYILFTPLGIIIGGDQRFGSSVSGMAVSRPECSLPWFVGDLDFEYLGTKFFGRKPDGGTGKSGKSALAEWTNDVGWLAAVQQEFKRLYAEKVTT